MIYTVKRKRNNGWFWHKIKGIKNDWILFDLLKKIPKRVFLDKNKNTTEINLNNCIIVFSKERPNDFPASRITFNAKYRKNNGWFWHKIKSCVVDTVMYQETETPIRIFITESGERWEIPSSQYEFKFDKNKLLAIQDVMEQESGQKIDAIK